MKKYLLLSIILGIFISSNVMAEEGHWYVGAGVGKTFPGFTLLNDFNRDYKIESESLQDLIGTDTIHLYETEEFDNYAGKVFFGRTFGKNRSHAVEFSLHDFGRYALDISGGAHNPGPSFQIGNEEYTTAFDTTAEGHATGNVRGASIAYVHFFHLGKNKRFSIFPKVGINYLRADAKAYINIRGEGYVDTTCGEKHCRLGLFGEEYRTYNESYNVFSATVGVGATYKIGDRWKIRADVERNGRPDQQPYITTYSFGFMYHFGN